MEAARTSLFQNLGLNVLSLSQFQVMIGNGEQLVCQKQCIRVPVILGTTAFTIDFFILPISY